MVGAALSLFDSYGTMCTFRIPLERGRDIATQYGVAPLLAPLFDFVPNTNAIGALPPGMPSMSGKLLLPSVSGLSQSFSQLPATLLQEASHPRPSCPALLSGSSIKDALKVSLPPRLPLSLPTLVLPDTRHLARIIPDIIQTRRFHRPPPYHPRRRLPNNH